MEIILVIIVVLIIVYVKGRRDGRKALQRQMKQYGELFRS